MVKLLPAMQKTRVWSLGREDPLEKAMAPHSSTLAWKIPWMEEPGRLQSMGSQSQNSVTSLSLESERIRCVTIVFRLKCFPWEQICWFFFLPKVNEKLRSGRKKNHFITNFSMSHLVFKQIHSVFQNSTEGKKCFTKLLSMPST